MKHVLRLLTLTIFVISLSGCWWDKKINVSVEAPPRAPLVLPVPDMFKYEPIPWYIVTEDTAQDVFDELKKDGYDPVIFGLTDKGYENISLNQAKILKLMTQFKAMIKAFKEYYKEEGKKNGTNTGSNK